jgi:hypothetical protein
MNELLFSCLLSEFIEPLMFFVVVDTGDTPLSYSAYFGRAAATRYLLDHGADPLAGKSMLPLHGAAGEGLSLYQKLYLGTIDWPYDEMHT